MPSTLSQAASYSPDAVSDWRPLGLSAGSHRVRQVRVTRCVTNTKGETMNAAQVIGRIEDARRLIFKDQNAARFILGELLESLGGMDSSTELIGDKQLKAEHEAYCARYNSSIDFETFQTVTAPKVRDLGDRPVHAVRDGGSSFVNA